MKVLILGLNYLPESTSIGPYTAGLAEYLCREGHRVEVVTGFPMAPSWAVWSGYRNELFRREFVNGVRVLRTFLYVPKEPRRLINRMLFDFSFMLSSLIGGLFTKPCDVIVTVSPPLQLGVTGWLLSRMKRAPLVLHIQDIVPGVAVAAGLLRADGLTTRMACSLARFIYRRASAITVISDGFRRRLETDTPDPSRLHVIPNFIDPNSIRPRPRDNGFRERHGIRPTDFLVMYSGSIGMKQALETLVDAANLLRDVQDIRFFIVGEGPSLEDLRERAHNLQVQNIRFLPFQPRESLDEQLSAADVLVITQRAGLTDSAFPGKLLYYMAVARPILASVDEQSETGRFVSSHGIGVVTQAENAELLAAAIVKLRRQDVLQIGRHARAVVEGLFDQAVVLPRFANLLENCKV